MVKIPKRKLFLEDEGVYTLQIKNLYINVRVEKNIMKLYEEY